MRTADSVAQVLSIKRHLFKGRFVKVRAISIYLRDKKDSPNARERGNASDLKRACVARRSEERAPKRTIQERGHSRQSRANRSVAWGAELEEDES